MSTNSNAASVKYQETKNWQDMTAAEWEVENERINGPFMDGNLAVELPLDFLRIDMEFGTFIEIQPANEYWPALSEERILDGEQYDGPPGVIVRDDKDGNSPKALKVLLPKSVTAGDRFVLTHQAKSGKSWHGRILDMDERFDTQLAEGTISLAKDQHVTLQKVSA